MANFNRRLVVIRTFGIALLLLGAAAPVVVFRTYGSPRGVALDEPLTQAETFQDLNFAIDSPGEYRIIIEANRDLKSESERALKHKELECTLGIVNSYAPPNQCSVFPRSVDFDFVLYKDGSLIQIGTYAHDLDKSFGIYSDSDISAIFIDFNPGRGRYDLRLTNLSVKPPLTAYHPRAVVQPVSDIGPALMEVCADVFGAIAATIGLVLIFITKKCKPAQNVV